MPNRVLRDWTDSEKMNSITSQAERFFTRLIMKADDFGCFHANPKLLKAALFPLNDEIRDLDLAKWVKECDKAGLIITYMVNTKHYLQIIDFGQRLRASKSKFPLPHEDPRTIVSNSPSNDSNLRPETETETETEARNGTPHTRYNPDEYFQSGTQAFEEIKSDQLYVERLIRVVHGAGFRSCGAVDVIKAVKGFLTIESAKEEFSIKPKREVKNHLVNWINKNAKKIHEYA